MRVLSLLILLLLAAAGRDVVADSPCSLRCITLRNRSGTTIAAVAVIGSLTGEKSTQWVEKDLRPGETRHVKMPSPTPLINDIAVQVCLPKGAKYALRAWSSPFEAPPAGLRVRAVCLDLITVAMANVETGARELGVGGTFHVYLGDAERDWAIPLEVGGPGLCDKASEVDWTPFLRPGHDPSAGTGRAPKPFHHISVKNISQKPVIQTRARNNAVPTVVHRVGSVAGPSATAVNSNCTCPTQYDTVNSTRTSDMCVQVTLSGGNQWYTHTADAGAGLEITKIDITVNDNGPGAVTVAAKVYRNDPTNNTTPQPLDVSLTAAASCGFD